MKKLRLLVAGMMAITILATPVAVFAESDSAPVLKRIGRVLAESTDASNASSKAEGSKGSDSFEKLFEAEKGKQTQADRIKSQITAQKVKLTAAETARFKLKCVAGQTKVKALGTTIDSRRTARLEAYDSLTARLDTLIAKLKAAKVDTTKLEEEKTELASKVTTFKTDLAKYKVALDDLQSLGCQADPTGFKAALETARSARATVAADAAAIRAYVKDPIKVTLADLKTTLTKDKDDKTTDASEGGDQ